MRLLPGQLFIYQVESNPSYILFYIIGNVDISEIEDGFVCMQSPMKFVYSWSIQGPWSESYIASHDEIIEFLHDHNYVCAYIDDTTWVSEI